MITECGNSIACIHKHTASVESLSTDILLSDFTPKEGTLFFLPSRTVPVRECLIAHGASRMAAYVSERILQHSVCKWGKRALSTGVKLKRAEGAEQDEREKFLDERKRYGGVFAA